MTSPYVRDRLTWLAYWMLGYGAYAMGLLGPLMPFLREERQLSFTLGGVLTTAIALGTIVSGLISDTLTQRLGRRPILWLGAAGAALGAAGLAFMPGFPGMLASVLLMGFCCSITITTVAASLSDHHSQRRSLALTESNVVAAVVTALGPFAIGGFQRLGLGWQGALFVPAVGLVLLAALYRRVPFPETDSAGAGGRTAPLPRAFWAYWMIIVLVVSIEWSLLVWGADYLETVIGLSKVNAATAMGVYLGAIVLGRALGSRLTRQLPASTLLLLALAVTALGFPLFWLPRLPVLNLVGLFIAGLGIASLFPFALSVAVGLAPGQANTASARVSLGVGVAIFAAPIVLGWAADRLGLPAAYGLVPALTVVAMATAFFVRRWSREPAMAMPVR